MLELNEVSLIQGSGINEQAVLHQISAQFPAGQCVGLIGPSGAGIRALLKMAAGILPPSEGSLSWNEPGQVRKAYPGNWQIGFVPQEYSPRDYLTVSENIWEALKIRVKGLKEEERRDRLTQILVEVGLRNVKGELARSISDEQLCRLKLAMELTGSPRVLLCEDIASGLDPRSELEIIKLLREIAAEHQCLVLIAPRNLRHLELFDSLLVLHEGHVAYHGPGEFLLHYFNINSPEGLFLRLSQRRASEWHASWNKHRAAYYTAQTDGYQPVKRSEEEPEEFSAGKNGQGQQKQVARGLAETSSAATRTKGSPLAQILTLLSVEWKQLLRRRARLLLGLGLTVGLPCLVVGFAWGDLSKLVHTRPSALAGSLPLRSLVSGLVMFQAVLLGFVGALNGSPRAGTRRSQFEKDKFDGLRPICWVTSKAVFLAGIVAIQSFWMAFFVKQICRFPGDLLTQAACLFAVSYAISALCLGISSLMSSGEKGRMAALYVAIIQLPLSGAILALPEPVTQFTRLLDTVYWGWAGYLQTVGIHPEGAHLSLAKNGGCHVVLGIQCLAGFCMAWVGARRNVWKW